MMFSPHGERENENPYKSLRLQALRASRQSFEISPATSQNQPWAAIMDWGIADDTITVVALCDGSASVYMSRGGGSIGGRSSNSIRAAALSAVSAASEVWKEMQPVTEYPLPGADNVTFYVRTDTGIVGEGVSVEEVSSGDHRLSKLGNAMQIIITRYRELES